ncbi:MAG: hypothetical protein CVT76_09945 [Alphaproteobacteria bacterium HGW-Alphaproteobacteria-15]|nr:MAG: hypothetical protein CVT76_09945 [Alphaproteobacteria bacterium HGW-Alphaproteobacteria-15]
MSYATINEAFALAQQPCLLHMRSAFQASSPKTFKARPSAGLFLSGANRKACRAFFVRHKSSFLPGKLRRLLIAFTFPCS